MMYYQKKDFDNARVKLEKAKALNESFANARYMLGLVYDKQGETQKAIVEMQKVLQLNPQNEEIKIILENLQNSRPALSGIEDLESPIQEVPPEINE